MPVAGGLDSVTQACLGSKPWRDPDEVRAASGRSRAAAIHFAAPIGVAGIMGCPCVHTHRSGLEDGTRRGSERAQADGGDEGGGQTPENLCAADQAPSAPPRSTGR